MMIKDGSKLLVVVVVGISMISYDVVYQQLVGTILRNGTERNDGLNYGTERFLKLKLATYHY